VWDIDSLNFLLQYNPPFIKVASACQTDIPLLTAIKQAGLPVILSCGMSNMEELMTAWYIMKDLDLTILHCNSSYPSKDEELDLTIYELTFFKKLLGLDDVYQSINDLNRDFIEMKMSQ
jgi:N-acetylneuraminate synthase